MLPLISQLACRLGFNAADGKGFQLALRSLLLRVARAHLHMVLPLLLALSYGNRFAAPEASVPANHLQMKAAQELIDRLRGEGELWAKIVDSTRLLVDFYLQVRNIGGAAASVGCPL